MLSPQFTDTTLLGTKLTDSPLPAAVDSELSSYSSSSSSSGSSSLDGETLAGDVEPNPVSARVPSRFRSASLALDKATASFRKYKGKGNKSKEDPVLRINTELEYIATTVSPLTAGAESSVKSVLQNGVNTLVEGLPELLKVLQDVSAIHPFIQLAVGAFKVAIELDLKRRENDKKISLLFLEMRDMMSSLTELQNVQDGPLHVGRDGKTLQGRLRGYVDGMAQDIKECANTCDTYSKKKLISKVFQGARWDEVMEVYIRRFIKRRGDIEFALAIHLGMNIDIAQRKLDTIDSKVDLIINFLRKSVSSEQREVAALIQEHGGKLAVLGNEPLLADLYKDKSTLPTPTPKSRRRETTTDFCMLKAELLDDPDIAIANNMETFERKFRMQQRELADEMRRIVYHQGDLVINAVTAGPHDRIIDPDLRNIWKEMRWRGNVKARHFVLALRDYCLEKFDKLKKHEATTTFGECEYATGVTEQDEWTLEYINVTRLQAIIEAFDDDASGFITVGEANAFTTSRPANWSLLRWMAYWAVGWQMAVSEYAARIDHLLEKMFSVKALVLPANRRWVERYLDSVWTPITQLTMGFRRTEWTDAMREKFEVYVTSEEEDMKGKLEDIRYDIDAADTLVLIAGRGRIEKNLFVILYLLLKRDFEIMRLARNTILHKDELWDSANTLEWVFQAVDDRHRNLENLFKQQNYDPTQQFRIFAFELFNYWHDPSLLWSFDRLRETRYVTRVYNDAEEAKEIEPPNLLNHPMERTDDPLTIPDFVVSAGDDDAQDSIRVIIGHWCGFLGQEGLYPAEPMISLDIHAASSKAGQFIASGLVPAGTRWQLVGEAIDTGTDKTNFVFTITYAARFWPRRFQGTLSQDGRVFSGSWTSGTHTDRPDHGNFFFKRLSCDAMRFWPTHSIVLADRPRALWRFALCAIQDQVRRQLFAKSRVEERQETRQRYLRIVRLNMTARSASMEDLAEMQRCYLNMTPSEARYFHMVYEYRQRIAPKHFGVSCSQCRADVHGARIICLDCHTPRITLDLCEKPDCLGAVIGPDRRADLATPHLPSHRLLKLRKVIHRHREFGGVYRAAHDALTRAGEALEDAQIIMRPAHARHNSLGGWAARGRVERIVNRELSCVGCRARVSQPCWYCIECDDDTFICPSCEAGKVFGKGGHKSSHSLVLCQSAQEESKTDAGNPAWLDRRMDMLETTFSTKFEAMQRESTLRLDALDKKLDRRSLAQTSTEIDVLNKRMEKLDDKMESLEKMLSLVLAKLSNGS